MSAMTVPIMNRYGSGRMSMMSRTITATVSARLNQNSFGRRVARLGSSAVFDRPVPEPAESPVSFAEAGPASGVVSSFAEAAEPDPCP